MKSLFTPHQVAKAIGVSESSLKRWCDKGLLCTQRTAGGHRRVALASVLQFARSTGQEIAQPELIGLPAAIGKGEVVLDRAAEQLHAALLAGDESAVRRTLLDLYLARHSIAVVGDRVIAPALALIGNCWSQGTLEVYRERRSCELLAHVLHDWRGLIPVLSGNVPRAIGGTLEQDPYVLPTTLVELTLRESGWRADSFGTLLPFATLIAAIREERPKLCWLSVSYLADEAQFCRNYAELYATAKACGTALVVGGWALNEQVRRRIDYLAFCDQLSHLVSLVSTLDSFKS